MGKITPHKIRLCRPNTSVTHTNLRIFLGKRQGGPHLLVLAAVVGVGEHQPPLRLGGGPLPDPEGGVHCLTDV